MAKFCITDDNKKICSSCKELLPVENYSKSNSRACGIVSKCKKCVKDNYQNNKNIILEKQKNYYHKCKQENPNINKEKYWKNPEKYRKDSLINYNKRKQKVKEYTKKYNTERLKEDVCYKISKSLRTRLYVALKKNYKKGSAIRDLGCSIEEFIVYISEMFDSNMSWSNYGKYWTIDHIIPLSLFNLTNENCLKKAVHFTNLQPLEKIQNIKKGNKL